jgi:hypothetical protein
MIVARCDGYLIRCYDKLSTFINISRYDQFRLNFLSVGDLLVSASDFELAQKGAK